MEKRGREVFYVKRAKTERLRKSAVVNMQKLLNKDASEKRKTLKIKLVIMCQPVNYDCMQSNPYHCENKTHNNNISQGHNSLNFCLIFISAFLDLLFFHFLINPVAHAHVARNVY